MTQAEDTPETGGQVKSRFAIGLGNTIITFGWKPLIKVEHSEDFVVIFGRWPQ